jgi:hypothetical protein
LFLTLSFHVRSPPHPQRILVCIVKDSASLTDKYTLADERTRCTTTIRAKDPSANTLLERKSCGVLAMRAMAGYECVATFRKYPSSIPHPMFTTQDQPCVKQS